MFRLCKQLEGHTGEVRCATILPNFLITGGFDATCIAWEIPSWTPRKIHGNSDFIYSLSPHETQPNWFISASKDRQIFVFDALNGEKVGAFEMAPLLHKGPICSLALVGNNTVAAGSWDGSISVWNLDTYELVSHIPKAGAYAVVVCGTGSPNKLLSGSGDKSIKLWDLTKCTTDWEIANAHSDIVRSIKVFNDIVVSSSNDMSVKCWTMDQLVLGEMHGHTNFVFDADISDHSVVSGGEDRQVQIWDLHTFENSQTIPHPGTLWFTKFVQNRIITGCSDGIVRVFSSIETEWTSSQEQAAFAEISQPPPEQQVDPKTVSHESEMKPGKQIGQIQMFKNDLDEIFAYQWTASGSWEKIGLVTGGGASKKATTHMYVGDQYFEAGEYDYVFDVELGENGRMAKLPFNRNDNPLVSAERFCAREIINKSNISQIVEFIKVNTNDTQKTQPTSPTSKSAMPKSVTSTHFPPLNPFCFREGKLLAISEKLKQTNVSLPVPLDMVEIAAIESVLKTLGTNRGEFRPSEISLIHTKLPTIWPNDQLFLVFDLWRLFVLHPGSAVMYKNTDGGNQYMYTATRFLNSTAPNVAMCAGRYLANLFSHSTAKWAAFERNSVYLSAVVDVLANPTANKQIQLACASILANLAICTVEKRNVTSTQLAPNLIEIIPQCFSSDDPEVVYRLLVATGCALVAASGEIPSNLSKVLETVKQKFTQENIQQCVSDILGLAE